MLELFACMLRETTKGSIYSNNNEGEIPMTITSFNPLIVTKDAEAVIALFEALGFERRHTKEGFGHDVSAVRMKDSNGL